MAKYGEWNQAGASLTEATAQTEFGVSREFLIQGIRAGKLEFRHASMYGNPCLKLLRSQVELYIAEEFGPEHFAKIKLKGELDKVKKEIGALKKKLRLLEKRQQELEQIKW